MSSTAAIRSDTGRSVHAGKVKRPRTRAATQIRSIELCEGVMDIVAALFNVSGRELRQPGRSTTGVTRVRQIGMYVAHVVLQLTMTDVGRGFGRNRGTVLHACKFIEDLRDDMEFDSMVAMTERITEAAFRNRDIW